MAKPGLKTVNIDDLKTFDEINTALGIRKHAGLSIHKTLATSNIDTPFYYRLNGGSTGALRKTSIINEHELSSHISRVEVSILHDGNTPRTWTASSVRGYTEYSASDTDLELALFRNYLKHTYDTETLEVPEWMN